VHLGGATPTWRSGWTADFAVFQRVPRQYPAPAQRVLKQFYYDTVNFDLRPSAWHWLAGVDHILAAAITAIKSAASPRCWRRFADWNYRMAGRSRLFGGNASRLLAVERLRRRGCWGCKTAGRGL